MTPTEWAIAVRYGLGPCREVRVREVGGQERGEVMRFDDRDPSVGRVPTDALVERRLRQTYGGEHVVVSTEVLGD